MDKKYKSFIMAAEEGRLKIVKSVLNDPDIDINYKDDQGFTALMYAAEKGHKEVTKLLFEYDAKIESIKKKDSKDSVRVQNSLSSKDLKSLVINEWKLK